MEDSCVAAIDELKLCKFLQFAARQVEDNLMPSLLCFRELLFLPLLQSALQTVGDAHSIVVSPM